MKVTVNYAAGHSRTSEWLKTGWHCLSCGKQEVWCEEDEGDYYTGPEHICTACGSSFSMQGLYSIDPDKLMYAGKATQPDASVQVLRAIRDAEAIAR